MYMRDMLKDFRPETTVNLRHSDETNRLEEPRSRTNWGCRAFERAAPRLYNRLPPEVRQSPNCAVFRKRLKTHLFSDSYDLIEKEIKDLYRV